MKREVLFRVGWAPELMKDLKKHLAMWCEASAAPITLLPDGAWVRKGFQDPFAN